MNCQDIGEILDNGDVGRLDEAVRREVAAHTSACASCARDWELHARFALLPHITQPAGFAARCRALVTDPRSRKIQRPGRRLVLIGTIVAISAAAAMVAAHRWRMAPAADAGVALDSGVQAGGFTLSPVTAVAAANSQSPAPAPAPAPAAASASPEVPAPPPAAPVRFSVQIMPLQNDARDAAGQAHVAHFYQAMLAQLRTIDGLRLLLPDAADEQSGEAAEVQLWISGAGTDAENKFTVMVRARRNGPGAVVLPIKSGFDADCAEPVAPSATCLGAESLAASLIDLLSSSVFPADPNQQHPMLTRLQDVTLAPNERLEALHNLAAPRPMRTGQTVGMLQPGNLRDPAIVRAAVELAATAAEPAIRAQVWRRMRGVGHADLLRPLIAAGQLDPDRAVRIEAIGTLGGDYARQPEAVAALEAIAQQDQSPLVRAMALRELKGGQVFDTYIFESLQDASLPDEARIEAMLYDMHASPGANRYRRDDLLKDLVNFGAIPTLTEVLGRVANTGASQQAVVALMGHLGTLGHPAITDLLLERVEMSRDGEERKVVLTQLARRVADPRVRAALTQAAASDPDPELRKLAQDALATPQPHTR